MALEDDFSDILKKARAGRRQSVKDLSGTSGVPESEIADLERGHASRDREQVKALADALELRSEPLDQIASGSWTPRAMTAPDGLDTVLGSIGGYEVKGYLLRNGGEAVLIDTAYNAPRMLEVLARRGLRLVGICLTHGHADHAEGIGQILMHREVPVYLGPEDVELLHWRPRIDLMALPTDGHVIKVGRRSVQCLATPGHTPGGICYLVDDPRQPVCFVGDTLFAGSIGRSNPSILYPTHLDSVRTRVLALTSGHRLFPGHGPATTVAEELDHNPFMTIE